MTSSDSLILKFEYNLSPRLVISADNRFVLDKKFSGNGISVAEIPCNTQKTSLYLLDKNESHTIVDDNKIIDDQFVKILGVEHQGLCLDEKLFLHYFKPTLIHNSQKSIKSYLGFPFPSKLEFLNNSIADMLIQETLVEVQ